MKSSPSYHSSHLEGPEASYHSSNFNHKLHLDGFVFFIFFIHWSRFKFVFLRIIALLLVSSWIITDLVQ